MQTIKISEEMRRQQLPKKIKKFLMIKCVLSVSTDKIWNEKKGKRWKENYCNTFT